jgi:hypothetical protein
MCRRSRLLLSSLQGICALVVAVDELWFLVVAVDALLLLLLHVLLLSFRSEAKESAVAPAPALAVAFALEVACTFVVIPQRSEGICGCSSSSQILPRNVISAEAIRSSSWIAKRRRRLSSTRQPIHKTLDN